MHFRQHYYALIFLLWLPCTLAEMRCGTESDGIDGISEEEIPLCVTADDGANMCPLGLVNCEDRSITTTNNGTCNRLFWSIHMCDLDGTLYGSESSCTAACQTTTTVTSEVCPSGPHACHDVAGNRMCSSGSCFDTDLMAPATPLTTESLSNDAMTSDGECTGEIQFFPGTKTGCRLGGFQTRWDNCCNNGDKMIGDAFNNPVENSISMIETVFSEADAENYEEIAKSTGVYWVNEALIEGLNWLVTPCAEDSPAVAAIASGYCTRVGTKCIEEWDGVGCVQRAEVHCCFNTRMAQIVHEQGRPQLPGFGWGDADHPNCNGFTAAQFQSLDFSRIDFSDYEEEIRTRAMEDIEGLQQDALDNATLEYAP